jgi:hypothetical protein
MDAGVYAIHPPRPPALYRRGTDARVQGSVALDLTLLLLPPLALALLATAHVAIVARLFGAGPRWRALAALFLPPLALVWGPEAGVKVWCRLWLGAALTYVLSVAVAVVT